jgi:2-polyprenyl-3-methyl-5-hydroxy-6-metoxy-1,4-benzoquinol methylase
MPKTVNGEFIARMHSLGWTVAGAEPDPQAVAHARSRGLEVFSGMILDVASSARCDVITLSHVLEHVTDRVELLSECRNRLRPGTEGS